MPMPRSASSESAKMGSEPSGLKGQKLPLRSRFPSCGAEAARAGHNLAQAQCQMKNQYFRVRQ
jgi:hypothetical protein